MPLPIVSSHFAKYNGFDMYWETQAQKLLPNDVGEISGEQMRKIDGRRMNIQGKKAMLACGGFEGFVFVQPSQSIRADLLRNEEIFARYVGL